MDIKKKFLLFFVILLFCIFTAYNLYAWKYYTNINKIETGLNKEFEELKALTNDTELLNKIEIIEEYVKFQQYLFIGVEENVIVYE